MTTTTEASEALDRLREVVKPGDTLYVFERQSRTRQTLRLSLRAVRPGTATLVRLNPEVAAALGVHLSGSDGTLVVLGDYLLSDLLDRLSVALFGEPGQIKGEYL